MFLGYLPRSRTGLTRLWEELTGAAYPVVAFESARRLGGSLSSLAEVHPDRPVAVCRELTKRFEEVVRGTAAELAARFATPPKGEITVVIGGMPRSRADSLDRDALESVSELVAAGVPRRDAVALVARLTGLPRNRLYRASL